MPFNNVLDRTDAGGLIPEPEVVKVIDAAAQQSAALRFFDRVTMSKQTDRISVQSALPIAYWVNGDTGMKQTTEAAWAKKDLVAEEIAAIVPIPENVIDDASFDVWARLRPQLATAIGRTLDAAIFFGTNKPASFPTAIITAAVAAGNTVTRGTNTAANGGVAQDVLDVFGKVEDDGYDVNGIVAKRSMKGLLRRARDTTGQKLLDVSTNEVEGVSIAYVMDGLWPTGATPPGLYAELIAGDFTQGILGVRQDVTYKILSEGVITDNGSPPVIIFNLPQQDMVALRVKARFAFQVANPINWTEQVEANRYPWAVLRSPAS